MSGVQEPWVNRGTGARVELRWPGDRVRLDEALAEAADAETGHKPTWTINGRQVELCDCGNAKYVDAVCPSLHTPDHGAELGESDPDEQRGVWVAYHTDGSGWVVFQTEIEALRHALPNLMQVKFARFGDEDWRR